MADTSITPAEIERFWSRVDRGERPFTERDTACWLWTAGTNSRGYGRIRWQGQPESAHRIAWTLAYGPIPQHQRVIPTCHNPRCCNPAHLTLVATSAPNPRSQRTPATRAIARAPSANRGPVVSQLRAELAQLRAELAQLKAAQGASPTPTAVSLSTDN